MVWLFAAACGDRAPRTPASMADILAAQGAGQGFLQQDRLEEARAEFLRLVELAPEESAGYAGLGLVALRAGDLAEAERRLREARQRSPDDPELILALARLRREEGEVAAARRLLEESLARDSTHARSLWALAELAGESEGPGGPQRRAWLERVVATAPGNLAARVALVDTHLRSGSSDAALGELERLRQVAPDFAPPVLAAFEAAEDAARAGDVPRALARFAEFREGFELSGPYQEGMEALRPPRGELVGVPQLFLSFMTGSLRVQEQEAVLAALRFAAASDLAGLADLEIPRADAGGGASSEGPPAGLALGDFDGDGDEDLAWLTGGEARFLRVDFGRFVEAAEGPGRASAAGAAAVAWGDYDDDRRLDVWLAGTPSRLLHNRPDGTLREVALPPTGPAAGPARDVVFADLDQDGDLDVFEARAGPNRLYRNNGDGTFAELAEAFGVAGPERGDTRAVAFADLDDDRDLDLVLAEGPGGARLLDNVRGGRFEDASARLGAASGGEATAVALGDVNGDGRIDIALAGPSGVRLLTGTAGGGFEIDRRSSGALSDLGLAPLDLAWVDYDNDGRLDLAVAGSAPQGAGLRLFRNDGQGRFAPADGHLPAVPSRVLKIEVFDYNEDGDADLLLLDGAGAPRLLRNDGGNANHYLQLELVGLGEGSRKNNRFGIGARLEIRAGDLFQMHTVTDPTVLVGLDGRLKADVIRVEWPNGVAQDLYFPGTDQDLIEQQTLKGSCPLLYVWNGTSFEFVGDVMWKSALGMPLGILGGDGARAYAPAFPSQEYRRLPDGVLRPRDGAYVMQLTEELWETIYVDEVRLVAVDHPDSLRLYVDEKFVPPAPTDLRLWRAGTPHAPVAARDEHGVDQLAALAARDFRYVAGFRPGRHQGMAEPHDLILDLGPAARADSVVLYLTGWIFPTDASINVALRQGGRPPPRLPSLQVRDRDGAWVTAIEDLGFPSGKDKTVIADLSGRFPSENREVRIRTDLQIFWDHAFFAVGPTRPGPNEARVTALAPAAADFHYRGFSREFRKGGRYGPHWFDYEHVSTAPKWHDLEGRYTRYGDVRPLLLEGDDMYVIANAGDEITLSFDAEALPVLPAGWTRTFLVYTDGWVKDGDLNTGEGWRVEPLPFRAASRYPYGPDESYPDDVEHRRYLETYNTRRVTPERF